ncbi:MAG: lactate racemase domain-containing protein [Candidatus Bathyarchaeia archaeon]
MSLPMVFPRMIEARQKIPSIHLDDYAAAIRRELQKAGLSRKVKAGMSVAVTAGSRGIAHYAEVLSIVVDEIKKLGGRPFLICAMGSHGGGIPEGQIEILKSLGITEETVGAPIFSCLEVDEIGRLENGAPVYVDRNALKADAVIIVGRVKPHTDFKDRIESGLMKMMVIGLGKQKGAQIIHSYQAEGYHRLIPEAARLIMKKLPVVLGLAIVENAYHEIADVKAVEPGDLEKEEIKLLEKAKELVARLPFREIDVLIVEEMGKNISGTGMDTNVTGRFWIPGEVDPMAPKIKRIVVLDLSEQTHGNAIGIGLADIITERLASKIDYKATYLNALTAGWPELAKIPVCLPNDRDAIDIALRTIGPIHPSEAKVVRIKNTLELEKIWISESLMKIAERDSQLKERLELIGELREMQFDILGTLAR